MGFQRWTKCGGSALHHHLQVSRDGEVLCPSSAALDAQEALAGELIALEYIFDQTGLVLPRLPLKNWRQVILMSKGRMMRALWSLWNFRT